MPRKPGLAAEAFADLAALDLLPPRGGRQATEQPAPARRETRERPAKAPPPKPAAEDAPPAAPAPARRKAKPAQAADPTDTARLTVDLPADLLEATKAAVYWTPGLTLRQLVEAALTAELTRRIEERGEDYPPRAGELLTGRPLAEPP